ncbi:flagellar protein FlaG [Salisediminibacterium halotolerans]|uniref:Flagellar protein FlaG n=1 Tax=Salisediminibacterium halotolerans TaxID=517425 RepID=A0A1H9VLS8_9BACI|nr:flagellar protein FlaG [Salisediminibacterium haloalkalitolerans]SES22153.1 flagellar protein FlaG [Salisediminibacterium haloalkalitolerans]
MDVKSIGSSPAHDFLSQQREREDRRQVQTEGQQAKAPAQGRAVAAVKQAAEIARNGGQAWSAAELDDAVTAMNELHEIQHTQMQYEKHETLDRTMVRVVDRDSEEVIREIPPEKFLDMISHMLEFAGLIVDEKA